MSGKTADCQASDVRKRYSRPQEGEEPFGARVLSFVCFAPNDGFCSQSGPVQREIINVACGDNAAYGSENLHNRASPAGNAPLLVLRTTFLLKGNMSLDSQVALLPYESSSFATPEGELYLPLSFYSHKQFKV